MCGIVGYWSSKGADVSTVARMAAQIQHRGPDDSGVWTSHDGDLALAHQRLSVIDLSSAGHQPMTSPCDRYRLIYNGEIYNHLELRADLENEGGHFDWQGHSDTETLLAALRHWGIKEALQRVNGMFAFALWDATEKTLFLARDRMGEKPLYYGFAGNNFLFGSELKSFAVHPEWTGNIDRDAMTLYMRCNCVPAPWSIYQGIKKLLPAQFIAVRKAGEVISDPQCYWNIGNIAERNVADSDQPADELVNQLDALLRDSVSKRMAADVPLGAFLSGGYDSATIAALMQAQSDRPINTFTIGFHEDKFNEAVYAKEVARHLGTNHTELYVTPTEAMSVIPRLPDVWDEPFADSSQIPTLVLCELVRNHVTVSLSGDGGDELFCGYDRYVYGNRAWQALRLLPMPLRLTLAKVFDSLPHASLENLFPDITFRLSNIATAFRQDSDMSFYQHLSSHWKNPESIVRGGVEPHTAFGAPMDLPRLPGLRERMMFVDSVTYLPDDILTKLDRASMAVSLETRVPMLDHRLVEFAWRIPTSLKYRGGKSKWILREVLNRYVPRELVDRPKKGFGVPIGQWLRGPLREWAENLLSEKRLREEGYFDPEPIRKMWEDHAAGHNQRHFYLWDVLMFQAWLESTKNTRH